MDDEYIVYPEYKTARCCRDWPHIPYLRIGACNLCGRKPEIFDEPYKRLRNASDGQPS